MAYLLSWKNPAVDANKTSIAVPVGSVVSNKASLSFSGKGAANYGALQQTNLMRLLENFADTSSPDYPTVGQTWYDANGATLRVCTSTSPLVWKALSGLQVTAEGAAAPNPASNGDLWYQTTGSRSGILHVYTGVGRHPSTSSAIGGWNQVWPPVEITAGREEYDTIRALVLQLVGPTSGGGSAALDKVVSMNDLTPLDADMVTKFNSASTRDPAVLAPITSPTTELLVDVTSQDWDLLLAAARYAINRLEMPTQFYDDVSPVPFVSDGRPAPASLLALPTSDVRYPSLERRSNRRFGIVSLINAYTETVNVLNAATQNQYSLKGINGATGTNVTFDPTTTVSTQATFGGQMAGATSGNLTVQLRFATAESKLSFLQSGGAIQLTLSHALPSSPTTADTNFKSLLDQRGTLRLTADKTRTFGSSLPLTLALAPTSGGLSGLTSTSTQLTTQAINSATYTVSASSPSATILTITIAISAGTMNGTFTTKFEVIKSNEVYQSTSATPVYGSPLAYATGDLTSSSTQFAFIS